LAMSGTGNCCTLTIGALVVVGASVVVVLGFLVVVFVLVVVEVVVVVVVVLLVGASVVVTGDTCTQWPILMASATTTPPVLPLVRTVTPCVASPNFM